MYRNILVAMDGSESSKRALNEAIRVAAFTTAKLRVVFVLDASEMYAYPVGFRDVLREDGRRVLEDAQRNLAEGGVVGEVEIVETANVPEDVASCLQRLVLRDRTDLVVMGDARAARVAQDAAWQRGRALFALLDVSRVVGPR